MEPQPAKHTIISDEHEQSNAAFYLASRFLLETFAANNEVVVVKADSGNFHYDPQMKLQLTGPSIVHITDAKIKESGTQTEISMSGVVESQKTMQCSFTLYFLMKRDVAVIPRRTTLLENVIGKSFIFHVEQSPESLHDSLFDLSLNRINIYGVEYIFGEGRGFLVFGMNEPKITH